MTASVAYSLLTTKNAYIGKTAIQTKAKTQALDGIGNILPDKSATYYLGTSDKRW
jgi:hypothetical protein